MTLYKHAIFHLMIAISRKQLSKNVQARSSNTNLARRHQCTPRKDLSRMYTRTRVCGIVSIIQQASKTPSADATPVIIIPHG
ncbi:hypothetical protein Taro_034005 [Colocasia esculenta]|uniref:Uncharacterized protein n=1 Tax=Colocasia esculenta TaxID=4460 RepID=A0A843WAM6_COLES|nr:hypothetical protein [Colocasia esculenta]